MEEVNKREIEENRPQLPSLIEQGKLEDKYGLVVEGFLLSSDEELKFQGLAGN